MSKQPGFLFFFTLTMTLLYIGVGLFFIFAERASEFLPGWKHVGLGIVFIAYAGYRYLRLKRIRESFTNHQEP